MEFLQGQESLTTIEWILRAFIAFFFLVAVARALGQRTISQLRLLGSITTTIVLVVLYLIGIFGILKFPALRKILNNSPIIIR